MTQHEVARAIGVTQPFVSSIERAADPQTPNADTMRAIYVLTEGAVEPNDFYDVPRWRAALIRQQGRADLAARKAA